MRMLMIISIVTTLAAAGVAFRSELAAVTSVGTAQLSQLMPDSYKVSLARENVRQLSGECAALEVKLDEARERKQATDQAIRSLEQHIKKLEQTKADGEQLLRRKGPSFLIGGRKHSRNDVVRDVQTRTAKLRVLNIQLASNRAMSASLAKAIEMGEQNLAQAQEHAQLLHARVESLAVELQANRVRGECSQLANELLALTRSDELHGTANGAVEELAARVKQIDQETRRQEALAALASSDSIRWDSEPVAGDARLEVDESISESQAESLGD